MMRLRSHTVNCSHLAMPLDWLLAIEQNSTDILWALRAKLLHRNTAVSRISLEHGNYALAGFD